MELTERSPQTAIMSLINLFKDINEKKNEHREMENMKKTQVGFKAMKMQSLKWNINWKGLITN